MHVELWLCMLSGAMAFGSLVELWALDVWCSCVIWMFGGAMSLGCLVKLWALEVWFSRNKMGDNKEGVEIVHYNGSHTQHQWIRKMFEKPLDEDDELKVTIYPVNIVYRHSSKWITEYPSVTSTNIITGIKCYITWTEIHTLQIRCINLNRHLT